MGKRIETPQNMSMVASPEAQLGYGEGAPDPKKLEMFRQYLGEQTIFIVDTASASRRRLASTLVTLGASMPKLVLHSQFDEAKADLVKRKPRVVISDYNLGSRSGLDLIQSQREAHESLKECIFVLVTGNTSQSAVARAAEEDVDSFILKPYTIKSLTETLISSSVMKLFPTPYRAKIEEGKRLLFSGQVQQSMPVFEDAMELNSSPALACFYYGQAEYMLQALQESKGSYLQGLSYNKIHYKCLVGLYELFMAQKAYVDAYEVVRRIQKYFPANPKRLSAVVRLAVVTGRFNDMEQLYGVFKDIEWRDDEVVRHMVAGLIVAGKQALQSKQEQRGLQLLDSASVSCAGQTQFLRKVTETLAVSGLPDAASAIAKTLTRFSPSAQGEPDYLVSKFLHMDLVEAPGVSMEFGRKLVHSGIEIASLYLALGRKLVEIRRSDMAEEIIQSGLRKFPDHAAEFEALMRRRQEVLSVAA